MKRPGRNLGAATVLLVDGAALALAGLVISGLADLQGAGLLGLLLLVANLAAAFAVAWRGAGADFSRITVAAALVANAVLLAGCGLFIAHTDDAPGAALIGLVLSLANLTAAAAVALRSAAE